VQRILSGLNLYSGKVDGLTGPQTRQAIEAYRRMVGLSASAEIDDQLLTQLGARPRSVVGAPPLPQGSPGADLIETSSVPARGNETVMRIQAGLRAFGNEGIDIDGVVGARTRAAILEFQSLFGLPETGEPDQALYAKMRDIGLAD
jgi:peptidoglycan hydrolase-like protein with peptidoglycan-binding domain